MEWQKRKRKLKCSSVTINMVSGEIIDLSNEDDIEEGEVRCYSLYI